MRIAAEQGAGQSSSPPVAAIRSGFIENVGLKIDGSDAVPKSVLDAIKLGQWDFEPEEMQRHSYDATNALPGSDMKLEVLSQRIRSGEPLWHPKDRSDCEGLYDEEREF